MVRLTDWLIGWLIDQHHLPPTSSAEPKANMSKSLNPSGNVYEAIFQDICRCWPLRYNCEPLYVCLFPVRDLKPLKSPQECFNTAKVCEIRSAALIRLSRASELRIKSRTRSHSSFYDSIALLLLKNKTKKPLTLTLTYTRKQPWNIMLHKIP